jgi:hypothetical protein
MRSSLTLPSRHHRLRLPHHPSCHWANRLGRGRPRVAMPAAGGATGGIQGGYARHRGKYPSPLGFTSFSVFVLFDRKSESNRFFDRKA